MYTARKKIQKEKGLEPSEFEDSVAQAFFDLENGNQELKSELKDLYINNAVQMDIAGNRKAVVIHVPYRLRKAFKKIHVRLVRELEKKFSGKDVVIVATRRIVRPPKKGSAVQRPRTRTLTAVHDGILYLGGFYPAEIVGKRIRYRLDGAKVIKIFLDPKERNNTEYKLETFSAVYRRLCGKDMYTARKKIQKEKGLEPSEFEDSVAQAFFDLENGNQELKSELKDLYINNAVQMDIAGNRKAVVIHVPYRLRKAFKKIHVRLVRELEKKFSGKDVILEDVVYPAEIVGKRIRYRLDGAKVIKIFLDPKERNNTEYKLETFSAVYRRLCGKDVAFEYPMTETA
uniref:40S ribosomal protein S7 n=2 Tax=Oryza rufipogon TaxID=4529 RepID=A0A0E0NTT6_ORYRU